MKLPAIPQSRRPILFAALALAVLLGAFGFVADEVIEGDTVVFDHAVTMVLRDNGDIMNPIGPAWLEEAGRDVTSLGSFSILGLIVILVLITLVLIKRPLAAAYVTFAVLSGTVLSSVFKQIYDRPRPPMLEAMRVFTSSFPSGHATVSAVVYLTLAALLAPRLHPRAAGMHLRTAGLHPRAVETPRHGAPIGPPRGAGSGRRQPAAAGRAPAAADRASEDGLLRHLELSKRTVDLAQEVGKVVRGS